MIHLLPGNPGRDARLSRRDWLRLSAVSTAGAALPGALAAALPADEDGSHGRRGRRATRCIYIFLCGGPSQLDMWDPKPEAPSEIRGPFRPLETNVPGVRFTELIPRTARHADKLAVVRSMTHDNSSHETGILYTLLATSSPPSRRSHPPSREDHPAIGAALHYLLGAPGELPAWVTVPRYFTTGSNFYKGQTAGFLGPAYDSFALDEPKRDSLAEREFELGALRPAPGLHPPRLESRRHLLERLDTISDTELVAPAILETAKHRERAFSLLSSDGARRAFDLDLEPAALRDSYGRNEYGQSFLLARRLVESGVRMVNVFWTYYGKDGCQFNLWDNHGIDGPVCGGYRTGLEMIQAPYCCPSFDRAYAALLEDLTQRGLLDETLVVVVGEFGRTPKINKTAGRDHWPNCYSVVLAGGGVRGGQTYGRSDAHAAYVAESPVRPDDLGATIFHAFGVSPESEVHDAEGRPLPVSRGTPLTALF